MISRRLLIAYANRLNRNISAVLIMVIFCCVARQTLASDWSAEVRAIESKYENNINQFIKGIDGNAFATVKVLIKTSDVKLPGVNIRKRAAIIDKSKSLQITQVDVLVYNKKIELETAALRTLLGDIIGVSPTILRLRLKSLPDAYDLQRQTQGHLDASNNDSPKNVTDPYSPYIAEWLKKFDRTMNYIDKNNIIIGMIITAIFLAFSLFRLLAYTQMHRVVMAIKYLGTTLAEADRMRPALAMAPTQISPTKTLSGSSPLEIAGYDHGKSNYLDYTIESFLGIISDCYWSGRDDYASFVWRQIPTLMKRELLVEYPILSQYASFVSEVEPKDYGLEQHPNYLQPLKISHLDNEIISKLVLIHPVLFHKLSPIRRENLAIPALKLIEIVHFQTDQHNLPSAILALASQPASNARQLSVIRELRTSIEEEWSVVNIDQPTPEIINSMPSLAWLHRLEDTEVIAIIDKYSARELAEAWLAPKRVLDWLLTLLPQGKAANLEEYAKMTIPSKQSMVFVSIYHQVRDTLIHRFNAVKNSPHSG